MQSKGRWRKKRVTRIRLRRMNPIAKPFHAQQPAACFVMRVRRFVSHSSLPERELSGAEAGSLGDSCTIFISFPGWSRVVCNNARCGREVPALRFPHLSKQLGERPKECKVSAWPSDSVWGPKSASSSWAPASRATAPNFTP